MRERVSESERERERERERDKQNQILEQKIYEQYICTNNHNIFLLPPKV